MNDGSGAESLLTTLLQENKDHVVKTHGQESTANEKTDVSPQILGLEKPQNEKFTNSELLTHDVLVCQAENPVAVRKQHMADSSELEVESIKGSKSHLNNEQSPSSKADANRIIADVVGSIESESIPPVAPPRKKKKKKLAGKASVETEAQVTLGFMVISNSEN